jgi:hypothetical protein
VNYGPERLVADLKALGHPVETRKNGGEIIRFVVIPKYEVMVGQFAGRVIDLGLQATADFPRSVHAAIHVRADPQLYEIQTIPNVRTVVASELGPDWRYWSHNFGWTGEERTARRLMSQINTIFERA